ncbi:MAG: MOSC domain-containing protein [Rhodobacterales bacterium]
MGQLAQIWRYPIKSHGREAIALAQLTAQQCLPGDRIWAIAHEASQADNAAWSPCTGFTRVASSPALAAIRCELHADGHTVTLSHPAQDALTVVPDLQPGTLLDWVRPLTAQGRARPARVVRVPGRGLTDSDYPSLTIGNLASHRAVEGRLGRALQVARWRANLWLDGLPAWEEFDWIGRHIRIGTATLRIVERTGRCAAPSANTDTGQRDCNLLQFLDDNWNHQDFCVHAEVTDSGQIMLDDSAKVL